MLSVIPMLNLQVKEEVRQDLDGLTYSISPLMVTDDLYYFLKGHLKHQERYHYYYIPELAKVFFIEEIGKRAH